MIVAADKVQLARDICATLAPSGGAMMFETSLSATGQAPATHYVSTGYIDADFANLMPLVTWYELDGKWESFQVSPGMPAVVAALCAEAGYTTTEADVAALFAVSDVSEQEPFTAFARLGLSMVQANEDPTG